MLIEHGVANQVPDLIRAGDYLGEAEGIVTEAVRLWNAAPTVTEPPDLAELAHAPTATCPADAFEKAVEGDLITVREH